MRGQRWSIYAVLAADSGDFKSIALYSPFDIVSQLTIHLKNYETFQNISNSV